MEFEVVAVVVALEELLGCPRRCLTHGHDREGDDIDLARVPGLVEVADAQVAIAPLAQEREARALLALAGSLVPEHRQGRRPR